MAILDGKVVAETLQEAMRLEIAAMVQKTGQVPGLTVIIVGDDPASKTYVQSKNRLAHKLGMASQVIELPQQTTTAELLAHVQRLNGDPAVHAILVQLPLPEHIDSWKVIGALDPHKDVDCFHPYNQGLILLNRAPVHPCTPAGIMKILDHYRLDPSGQEVVVLGRSFIVGKPMALLLANRNATVTLCHSKTRDLAAHVKRADIVVAAVGKPSFVSAEMVKPGAILIDVGINHVTCEGDFAKHCDPAQQAQFAKKGYAISGDIHPLAYNLAAHYTPVPGGVGTMTVTMLLHNTLQLYKRQALRD